VREGEEPTRRRALRSEFSEEEWRLVSELADHPNRLLVTATPESGETYAEVAHEAIFRRWDKLRNWIAAEREFLGWRSGLEASRRAWQATPDKTKSGALLMGLALDKAQSWLAKRREDLPIVDRDFIDQSTKRASKARARARRGRALVYGLVLAIILGLIGVIEQAHIKRWVNWHWKVKPYKLANIDNRVLKPEQERALKPGDTFQECAKDCPLMVVIPAGKFKMGSPEGETGRLPHEGPQQEVTIAKPFAVSKFEVTWDEWGACVDYGDCAQNISDSAWGHGTRPVINVTWEQVKQYVAWLSKMTGQTYRLLTEAEWEYAARAGANTAYPWGNEIGNGNANCSGCGSHWADDEENPKTAPVASFPPNAFRLHDMNGNVWEWVEDCYQSNYNEAPTDGSALNIRDCINHVIRGGSWIVWRFPQSARSAARDHYAKDQLRAYVGFRVARTLTP
jgi:formylglycine-generating enzyme required for sulfatase activity